MMRESMKRLPNLNWSRNETALDFDPCLKQFKKFLLNEGYRVSTIDGYVNATRIYLTHTQSIKPSVDEAFRFREFLIRSNKKGSTINNYCFAIRLYHKMNGEKFKFPVLKRNNQLPYFFAEDDIIKILDVCNNAKHYAMLTLGFYGMLRASELCSLTDEDLDLKSLALRIRDGKRGKQSIIPISRECGRVLRDYLNLRPKLEIQGRSPLFYTDRGNLWERGDVWRMVTYYKKKAGIDKPGGCHVLFRHSAASILIKKGCDILTIKELMRHNDITTTARYLHLADETKREKYERYLVLEAR